MYIAIVQCLLVFLLLLSLTFRVAVCVSTVNFFVLTAIPDRGQVFFLVRRRRRSGYGKLGEKSRRPHKRFASSLELTEIVQITENRPINRNRPTNRLLKTRAINFF